MVGTGGFVSIQNWSKEASLLVMLCSGYTVGKAYSKMWMNVRLVLLMEEKTEGNLADIRLL